MEKPFRGAFERFAEVVARRGEKTAIEVQRRDGPESWTFERLHAEVELHARALAARGIGAGDRCALLADNDADWCAAYLGILRLGAVAVPLDTAYSSEQVARLLADSEARLILVSPRLREGLDAPCAIVPLGGGSERPDGGATIELPSGKAEADQTAVILYTSGTTSDPKGVVLTHGNLVSELDSALHVVDVDETDAILGVLPLFHALAQFANLLLPVTVGARVVFLESVNTTELLRALREREITAFCCVPQFFYLVHQRVLDEISKASRLRRLTFRLLLRASGTLRERTGINLGPKIFGRVHRALGPSMRLLVSGGSRFDPRVGRDLYRLGFNIIQAYGLTETSGAATCLPPGDRHVDSVGMVLPGVELKIVPHELAQTAGAGESPGGRRVGEVAIRGPIVTPGYYRRPDVNAVAFRDGWLHTGDLGYLDGAGRLYITGRAKEMIVLGSGKNIYPEDVETHYLSSVYIKELCVMGRSLPDAPASERLHAVIVPDFDLLRERKIVNSREILRWELENLSAELPGYKRIMSYDLSSEALPRTTTRKLKRFEIERKYAATNATQAEAALEPSQPDSPEQTAWLADPHVARAIEVMRGAVQHTGAIRPRANLELDLGLDSMERVELLTALEARFGVAVPDDVRNSIHTAAELIDAVRPSGAGPAATAVDGFDPWGHLLDASDDDPAVASNLVSRPLFSLFLYLVSRVIYVLAWLFLGLRVSGREHLPQSGPCLISPNHQSFLDAFILVSSLPYRLFRHVFYVGSSEYFSSRFSAWIARLIHVVPVDPDANLVAAMRAGAYGLRRGKVLVLFPEGERSIDAEIKQFKKGAAILSLNVGTPIVPVALDGIFEFWPRGSRPRLRKLFPFSGLRTRIRFDPPLLPARSSRPAGSEYAVVTAQLRGAVEGALVALREGAR